MENNRLTFMVFASLLSTVGLFATDMYLPSLDAIRNEFNTEPGNIALSFSVYMLGFAVAQLFYGSISDQIGRKAPLLFGTSLFILGTVGCTLVSSIELFLVFRFIQAIGIGAAYVLWQPIVIDLFDENNAQTIFSFLMALSAISPAIAPFLGGVIAEYLGWRAVFYYLIFHGIILLVWTLLAFRESLPESRRQSVSAKRIVGTYAYFLGNRFFMGLSLTIACGLSLYLIFITLLPLIMSVQNHTPKHIGIMFIPLAIAFIFGASVGKRLFPKMGGENVIRYGFIVVIAGSCVLFLVTQALGNVSSLVLISCFCIVTFGNGLLIPTGSAYLIGTFSDKAGACASVMGFIISLMAVISTSIASLMFNSKGIYALSEAIMIFVVAMMISYLLIKNVHLTEVQR